jgi:thiol-disulfide isomerase/thioredoxin
LVAPRHALALAGETRHAGRSGGDLIVAMLLVLLATQLVVIVQAVAFAIQLSVGAGALSRVLQPLGPPLAALLIAAVVIWLGSGRQRELGRAFDLAAVAVLPRLAVLLAASVAHQLLEIDVSSWLVSALAYGWAGLLVVLAIAQPVLAIAQPRASTRSAAMRASTLAGRAVLVLAGVGIALQVIWTVNHRDVFRPLVPGKPAPAFALRTIGPHGDLGDTIAFAPGRVTVVDFWEASCQPCLRSLPQLDAFARRHPDVQVLAIALDHFDDARAVFDERGYAITLLGDDGLTSQRYGVVAIPHTVVIDRDGLVHQEHVGEGLDLEKELSTR